MRRITLAPLAFVLAACAPQAVPVASAPMPTRGFAHDTIVIAAPARGLYTGTTLPLTAALWLRGQTEPAAGERVHWTSDRVDRAWVADDGRLVVIAPGKVTLTAQYAHLESRLSLVVRENPASAVELSHDGGAVVRMGDTVRFAARVRAGGDALPDAGVHFAVSARGVPHARSAAIDATGLFVARAPGLYTVVAASGRAAATSTVLVSSGSATYAASAPLTVNRVEIDEPGFEPLAGTAFPLAATLWIGGARAQATGTQVAWASSNPSVARVDEHGIVVFLAPGHATITVQAGERRASRRFNVRRDAAAHMALTVNASDLEVGKAVKLREEVWQRGGMPIRDARVNYAVVSHGAAGDTPPTISEERLFIASAPGVYTIIAELGGIAEQTTVVVRPRDARVSGR
jgi:hypothetical protein